MSANFEVFDARLKFPFTMLVSGPPLSGKTTFVVRLLEESLSLIDKPIDGIVWFYGEETDSMKMLKKKFGSSVKLVSGIPPSFDPYFDKTKNIVFVLDDLMIETGRSERVSTLFSRQSHHQNISVILINQNLFHEGRERRNLFRSTHYLVVFNNPLDNSIVQVLANKIMPKHQRVFVALFEKATEKPQSYLFIDGRQDTIRNARLRSDIFAHGHQRVYIPGHWNA